MRRLGKCCAATERISRSLFRGHFETKEVRVQAKSGGPLTLQELTLWASAQIAHFGFALVDERPAMVPT